ncbi:hypothetical protein GCM10009560_15470 [Nonomuraea longicatena]|uniref:Uncharacterized protein n=1 Tax=Nonomuraea longicatena TaxID=83682 RepID=A0ABN1NWK0_9ACTN
MRTWRVASGMSLLAVATYLMVEGAQGNEQAIRQARTSWANALAGTIGVEGQLMPGVETVRRATTGWDTADQAAFELSLNTFNSQLGATKTLMEHMGDNLGQLADAYAEFDTALRLTGVSLITALTGLMVARAFPATAMAAAFGEAAAVRTANIAVIALIGQLAGFLGNAGMNFARLRSALLTIRTVLPDGPGAIGFGGAELKPDGLPPFQPPPERAPGQAQSLPPGSGTFDWDLP